MYCNIETDPQISFNNEHSVAEEVIETSIGSFKWDSVKGSLKIDSSFVEAENVEHGIKASLFDSFESEAATFKILKDKNETITKISHLELVSLLDTFDLSFVRVLNELVIMHFENE